jgi:hypothetical protein
MFSRWLFSVLRLFTALALAGEAGAADLPPVDPPGVWRTLTQDDATTDSKCIGKPLTPLCAVESKMACFLRGNDELCRIAKGLDHLPGLGPGRPYPGGWERYRVTAVRRVNSNMLPTITGITTRTGDLTVDVKHMLCQFSECPKRIGPPTTYLVRQKGDGWAVVTWETPRW